MHHHQAPIPARDTSLPIVIKRSLSHTSPMNPARVKTLLNRHQTLLQALIADETCTRKHSSIVIRHSSLMNPAQDKTLPHRHQAPLKVLLADEPCETKHSPIVIKDSLTYYCHMKPSETLPPSTSIVIKHSLRHSSPMIPARDKTLPICHQVLLQVLVCDQLCEQQINHLSPSHTSSSTHP